jgi:NAD(P)H-hydrate repair Nnr-like enzyme with NAD(P)H-hydrate dehydratase domain
VVGPGLGREQHMQAFARIAIQLARDAGLYLVLDADALLLLQNDPELIRGYRKAVVTPNIAEFARLCQALVSDTVQYSYSNPFFRIFRHLVRTRPRHKPRPPYRMHSVG